MSTLAPDEPRDFKAVHLRHPDVQENERIIALEQMGEGLLGGSRTDGGDIEALQEGFQGDEVAFGIIDQQDAGR